MSEETKPSQIAKKDLLSTLAVNIVQTNKESTAKTLDDSWDNLSQDGDYSEEEEPKQKLVSESNTQDSSTKANTLKDILSGESNKGGNRYNNKPRNHKKQYHDKKYNQSNGQQSQNGGSYQKPTFYSSQPRTDRNFTNSNNYYSNKGGNDHGKGGLVERKTFTNSRPGKFEDIKVDTKLLEGDNEIDNPKKFCVVGEIFKQTSMENNRIQPPKNNYEVDLKLQYYNSANTSKTPKVADVGNQQPIPKFHNTKKEFSTQEEIVVVNHEKSNDENGLQRPVFVNKKLDSGESNFVEIKQENDLFYKKWAQEESQAQTQSPTNSSKNKPRNNNKHKYNGDLTKQALSQEITEAGEEITSYLKTEPTNYENSYKKTKRENWNNHHNNQTKKQYKDTSYYYDLALATNFDDGGAIKAVEQKQHSSGIENEEVHEEGDRNKNRDEQDNERKYYNNKTHKKYNRGGYNKYNNNYGTSSYNYNLPKSNSYDNEDYYFDSSLKPAESFESTNNEENYYKNDYTYSQDKKESSSSASLRGIDRSRRGGKTQEVKAVFAVPKNINGLKGLFA